MTIAEPEGDSLSCGSCLESHKIPLKIYIFNLCWIRSKKAPNPARLALFFFPLLDF